MKTVSTVRATTCGAALIRPWRGAIPLLMLMKKSVAVDIDDDPTAVRRGAASLSCSSGREGIADWCCVANSCGAWSGHLGGPAALPDAGRGG